MKKFQFGGAAHMSVSPFNKAHQNIIPQISTFISKPNPENYRESTRVSPVEAFDPNRMHIKPTEPNWLDFVPVVGTIQEARRMDEYPSVKQGIALGVSAATDVLSFGLAGSLAKLLGKGAKYTKILKNRGFVPITDDGRTLLKAGIRTPVAGEKAVNALGGVPFAVTKRIPSSNPITYMIERGKPDMKKLAISAAAGSIPGVVGTAGYIVGKQNDKKKQEVKNPIKKHQKGNKIFQQFQKNIKPCKIGLKLLGIQQNK